MAPRRNDPSRRPGDDDEQDGSGRPGGTLRVDKWLWCTRFFKTRGLAQEAVEGGHVQLDCNRIKASQLVQPGDRLQVTRDRERFVIDVVSIPVRRGPAAEARLHYRETAESEAGRAHVRELNRLAGPVDRGRPDKRERRHLLRIVKGRGGVPDDGNVE